MTQTPAGSGKVSIIMNCYNSDKYLADALDSVLTQSYPDWELIFWDNGSTDASGRIATDYAARDPRIRYYYTQDNVRLGKARNKALEQARGDYITFLDCDDMWLPEKLAAQVSLFDRNSEIDFIYGNFLVLGQAVSKPAYPLSEALPSGAVTGHLLTKYRLNLQTVIFRATLLTGQAEWFDPALELCEEMELFLRMSLTGTFQYQKETLVKYRIHGNQLTVRKFDRFYEERGYIIAKLVRDQKNFAARYETEIGAYNATMLFDKSSDYVLQGRRREAIGLLSDVKFRAPKLFLAYLLAHFPIRFYLAASKLAGRGFLAERYAYLQETGPSR
jgi:glycosyltransferase involved in cell wall biosynthesis